MLLRLYIIISYLLYPLIVYTIHKRKIKGKEDILRINERYGLTCIPRPKDKLIWLHGASVGESLSMLPLIEIISKNFPLAKIMVTTGTITSANLLEQRLPKNAFHQYIPIDYPIFTKRFIKHWQPDCVLWFESDFWPNIIHQIGKNNIPLILINGRVSDNPSKDGRISCFLSKSF
jgi:3-deoxy-D-manno-octulosonic-acid transferase